VRGLGGGKTLQFLRGNVVQLVANV
jgi:hypothetical protein